MSVKVSVLMPACNVEKFLPECMDSIVSQTLQDIEIICVDDGSRDSTGEILNRYAASCPKLRVIHKENTGYGHSMNVALDAACGEYIGILETDDFVDPDAFEKLYEAAAGCGADVVKANYYTYVSQPEPKSTYFEVLGDYDLYDTVFCPQDHQEVMKVRASIWSGLYRREFLIGNGIRFSETPGASFQDTGFAFKVWACAKRAMLLRDAYLHYRTDNSASSVKNMSKVFCICDEYDAIRAFLDERPEKDAAFSAIAAYNRYEQYRWNLDRLVPELKWRFLRRMKKDMLAEERAGHLDRSLFMDFQWDRLQAIMHRTLRYYIRLRKEQR
ncbi:MAG: glycosyltransferase [Lachnospiraceae bacterium]|nr:glycosyltransferase [Lachnospiraceae bacterium]